MKCSYTVNVLMALHKAYHSLTHVHNEWLLPFGMLCLEKLVVMWGSVSPSAIEYLYSLNYDLIHPFNQLGQCHQMCCVECDKSQKKESWKKLYCLLSNVQHVLHLAGFKI